MITLYFTIIFYEFIVGKWFLRMSDLVHCALNGSTWKRLRSISARTVLTERMLTLYVESCWYYKILTIYLSTKYYGKRSASTCTLPKWANFIATNCHLLLIRVIATPDGSGFTSPKCIITFGHWSLAGNSNNWHRLRKIDYNDTFRLANQNVRSQFLIFATFDRKWVNANCKNVKASLLLLFSIRKSNSICWIDSGAHKSVVGNFTLQTHARYRMFVFIVIILATTTNTHLIMHRGHVLCSRPKCFNEHACWCKRMLWILCKLPIRFYSLP